MTHSQSHCKCYDCRRERSKIHAVKIQTAIGYFLRWYDEYGQAHYERI